MLHIRYWIRNGNDSHICISQPWSASVGRFIYKPTWLRLTFHLTSTAEVQIISGLHWQKDSTYKMIFQWYQKSVSLHPMMAENSLLHFPWLILFSSFPKIAIRVIWKTIFLYNLRTLRLRTPNTKHVTRDARRVRCDPKNGGPHSACHITKNEPLAHGDHSDKIWLYFIGS